MRCNLLCCSFYLLLHPLPSPASEKTASMTCLHLLFTKLNMSSAFILYSYSFHSSLSNVSRTFGSSPVSLHASSNLRCPELDAIFQSRPNRPQGEWHYHIPSFVQCFVTFLPRVDFVTCHNAQFCLTGATGEPILPHSFCRHLVFLPQFVT